jgi:two-component system OmpR family response regulator
MAADHDTATEPETGHVDAAAGASRERRVILVVEDDPFAAKLIVKALEGVPVRVEVAGDAREAIATLGRVQPAAILMDVMLPGIDGVALTILIKANPNLKHIPVVMLTGDATRETIERSMNAGAVGFLVKPFDRNALVAKLLRYLR